MVFALDKVTWSEVKNEVEKVNKELYSIIEEFAPNKNQPLIKAYYRFGDSITSDGVTYLPKRNGNLVPIDNADVPPEIKKSLGYAPIPLFTILKKSCEVFVHINNRIIPLTFSFPGILLGLFESLDFITHTFSQPMWSVSAGARSIFMLPRIAEAQGINRLIKLYKLPTTMSYKNFSDQWHIFKHLSQKESFNKEWCCEVLFFPRSWLESELRKPWSVFQQYAISACWKQIQYIDAISHIKSSIIWQSFHEAIVNRNLTPRPYLADTVKHLFSIAQSKYPAFVPADNTDRVAPIKKLQEIFIDVYGVKEYYPTFMYPFHFQPFSKIPTPVYYSLSQPTILDGGPEKNKKPKLMQDLREIKLLIDTFWKRSEWINKNAELQNITFDFFHTEKDTYGEIQTTEKIFEEDKRFVLGHPTNTRFCLYSHFWRGCVRINLRKG